MSCERCIVHDWISGNVLEHNIDESKLLFTMNQKFCFVFQFLSIFRIFGYVFVYMIFNLELLRGMQEQRTAFDFLRASSEHMICKTPSARTFNL